MKNNNTIHNIVASTILAQAMRHIRDEFMVQIRGYLRMNEKDSQLFIKAEHSARQALEVAISERAGKCVCPHCGSKEIDFDAGNGGDQFEDKDGNMYQDYSAVCTNCGKTVHLVAKYFGILTEEEYNNLQNNNTTSPFQNP